MDYTHSQLVKDIEDNPNEYCFFEVICSKQNFQSHLGNGFKFTRILFNSKKTLGNQTNRDYFKNNLKEYGYFLSEEGTLLKILIVMRGVGLEPNQVKFRLRRIPSVLEVKSIPVFKMVSLFNQETTFKRVVLGCQD